MERRLPLWGIVAGMACLTFFFSLGAAQLFDEDEPKNAECGREMFARGDWLVPTFNEELRTDKPILVYWLMLSSYHLFGVTEFAARFWSAALGVGSCLLTYHIGRILFSPRAGVWAGVMLGSTLMFTVVARASTPDSTLIFFTTLSLFLFVRLGNLKSVSNPDSNWRSCLPRKTVSFLAIYAAMAVAVLAKGPVGVLLPCVVIGFFLYITNLKSQKPQEINFTPEQASWGTKVVQTLRHWVRPGAFFRIAWGMRPYWILLCVAVIALPWYLAVGLETDGAWLRGFFGQHNISRFTKPMEGHQGPVFYYPIAILVGFFPWSVFALPVIRGVVRHLRSESEDETGLRFVVCWFTVYLVFFTCAQTKLPNYILPCYPAIALLTGWWFARASEENVFTKVPRDFRLGLWSLMGAGLVMLIGLGVATSMLLPEEKILAITGLVPLLGGLIVWRIYSRKGLTAARFAFCGVALVFILTVFTWAAPRISRHQDGAYIAGQLLQRDNPAAPTATFNYFPVGLVFYAEQPIARCRTPEDIKTLLSQPEARLITRADRLELLQSQLPDGIEVLARRRRFLRQHDIVILGRKPPLPIPLAVNDEIQNRQ